jgi:hypothetical protein
MECLLIKREKYSSGLLMVHFTSFFCDKIGCELNYLMLMRDSSKFGYRGKKFRPMAAGTLNEIKHEIIFVTTHRGPESGTIKVFSTSLEVTIRFWQV